MFFECMGCRKVLSPPVLAPDEDGDTIDWATIEAAAAKKAKK